MRALALLLLLCPAVQPQQLVRILSYNIHHGEGLDTRLDLPRIARVIDQAHPDLVALQEVDVSTERSLGVDQALELARLTRMHAVFGRTIPFQGGLYGNAVLTRQPVAEFTNHPLPGTPGREPRAVTCALITPSSGTLSRFRFFATHLDTAEPGRLLAVERINELASSYGPSQPIVLAGDLNATPDSKTLAALLAAWSAPPAKDLNTFPAASPTRQIDYVLFRPANRWRVVSVAVIDEAVASDHRPILAVLELLPPR